MGASLRNVASRARSRNTADGPAKVPTKPKLGDSRFWTYDRQLGTNGSIPVETRCAPKLLLPTGSLGSIACPSRNVHKQLACCLHKSVGWLLGEPVSRQKWTFYDRRKTSKTRSMERESISGSSTKKGKITLKDHASAVGYFRGVWFNHLSDAEIDDFICREIRKLQLSTIQPAE